MLLRKLVFLLFLMPGVLYAQPGTINVVPNRGISSLQASGLFTTNAQTTPCQVFASDFQQCKTISVASGNDHYAGSLRSRSRPQDSACAL